MHYSKLLDTRPSAFQSVFPLHTKSRVCVCTLDSDSTSVISYHDRAAPGNPYTDRFSGQEPLPRSPRGPTEPLYGSVVMQIPRKMTAQPTCSEHPTLITAWLVVFLATHYHRSRGELWKELPSYLPLILRSAKPPRIPH